MSIVTILRLHHAQLTCLFSSSISWNLSAYVQISCHFRSAEKHLFDPLVNTLNERLNTRTNSVTTEKRPSRSRSTYIPNTLREMEKVYRNRRSRASSTGGHSHSVEPNFSCRLTNALKSLKPAILTHSSSSSSAFRNSKVCCFLRCFFEKRNLVCRCRCRRCCLLSGRAT